MLSFKLVVILQMTMMSRQNVISITQGKVRGVARDGYVSYTGIPYANITATMARFKRAGIAPLWSETRNSKSVTCSLVSNAEDCLQLDVHAPAAAGGNWPVLVWVTGGSGPYYPGKIVQEGIIVVIVYHRLGPLGFLCSGDEQIPGNAGVKDVVLALRWVSDNIVAFKGNSAKVVVAGQSFGAAMVEAVLLSPMANGLYHGAILQSGSALCPWSFNYDAEERAKALGTTTDFTEEHFKTEILLDAKIEDLVAQANKLNVPYFPFAMCVENPSKKEERLLFEAPYNLLSSKKGNSVPMIIGYNDNEAYVFVSILREANALRRMSRGVSFLLPDDLKFLNERERKQTGRLVKDMYFKKNATMESVLAYHRDAYFSSHIHRSVRFHSSTSQVFYYQFSYSGDLGVRPEPGVSKTGAAHSDELAYLFSDGALEGEDANVQRRLVKLWTNFVKHLNPAHDGEVTWEATRADSFRLLDISTELTMKDYPHANTQRMWDDIYDKFYYTRNRIGN
ncbi:hypothetical protein PYW08_007916 [Mythimna loreyi]|uniref:Uncharacterized protein n=1 Tax=Mythimna loreyi TaxID=667449 RepID=A0ACC2QE40_9NEOP|nr:hypothetical protein PYW08_007916 [Mythimna loreyi]